MANLFGLDAVAPPPSPGRPRRLRSHKISLDASQIGLVDRQKEWTPRVDYRIPPL
jgi:hypothetical protein